ncbi:CopG family transcriptional regulator [Antarcticirhabdus aurantiaca]|uniref:CopG family transcriptional regulator n=1 Tax=Antarcticirhabdus aurantiaca TaxID=2606717 RepID=A0ACD4NMK6_9HYPH|nr:CopG family transcriptional regulator [Antarcticirhabdus aurantiaca]WAJ27968.1 CopG family transcriptional regulator [Jeongeuplla avenae]
MPRKAEGQDKAGETEKVTLNLGYVDLGRIDLLVREGFYSNRSDVIRTAIRRHLDAHEAALRQSSERLTLELGLRHFSRADLEEARAAGRLLHVRVLGLAAFDDDIPPDLARETIGSITVLGALQASAAVKAALADRIR